ncbi:MAG: dimethylarginine dimethylaminohydrolase family protein [Blastocatellia bacterium]
MLIALTRPVSPAIVDCELTHLARTPIDAARAQAQHEIYEQRLVEHGCEVIRLPLEPALPDSVFVEDTAIVVDELAIITRPGALSRRPETVTMAAALREYRPLAYIAAPGVIDGGDVLRVGRTLFIGLSGRTNENAIAQVAALLAPYGYDVRAVPLTGCLHLKTAVTEIADNTLLLNPAWVDVTAFPGYRLIAVDATEPMAANALRLDDKVIYATGFPLTQATLQQAGLDSCIVDMSELAKAEGGVTCCSVIIRGR